MRKLLLYITLLIPLTGFSQSVEDDELTFRSATDWLDRKLNYIYYDEESQKWWLNKFYVNEQKEVTIKNIFTNKPRSANIKEKVYLIRKFDIRTINPYKIEIRKIDTNQGRIVKGKLLELHTFSGERSVHKTVNGRRGSDVSFIQISFPTFLTDSIADYAELVEGKFKEAIIAATKVYADADVQTNRKTIFDLLNGNFVSQSGNKMKASRRFDNVISLEKSSESANYFGYDPARKLFYLTTISDSGTTTSYYELLSGEKLLLQNTLKARDVIEFETLNTFRMGDTIYYRE
ncbi:MAG: hypothetical protein RIM99_19500 [Cyclobacteriaceae bacterium]